MATIGTAESYRVFTRTWWRRNPAYPGGREPGAGRQTTLARHCTYKEALAVCERYNSTHKPGFLSRKAEFTKEGN